MRAFLQLLQDHTQTAHTDAAHQGST
jgi:hypothetical protein